MNAGAWDGETWRHVIRRRRGGPRAASAAPTKRKPNMKLPTDTCAAPPMNGSSRRACSFERQAGRQRSQRDPRASRASANKRSRSASGAAARCSPIRPGEHAGAVDRKAPGLKGISHRRRVGLGPSTRISSSIMGAARAADIEALIEHVRRSGRRRLSCRSQLTTEVRIVGEAAMSRLNNDIPRTASRERA